MIYQQMKHYIHDAIGVIIGLSKGTDGLQQSALETIVVRAGVNGSARDYELDVMGALFKGGKEGYEIKGGDGYEGIGRIIPNKPNTGITVNATIAGKQVPCLMLLSTKKGDKTMRYTLYPLDSNEQQEWRSNNHRSGVGHPDGNGANYQPTLNMGTAQSDYTVSSSAPRRRQLSIRTKGGRFQATTTSSYLIAQPAGPQYVEGIRVRSSRRSSNFG